MTTTVETARARPRTRSPGLTPRTLRDLHLWVGVFFAPTILFFATTGAIQVLGLHEASRDGGYRPPLVIEKLSEVHIHQRYAEKPKPPGRRAAAPGAGAQAPGARGAEAQAPGARGAEAARPAAKPPAEGARRGPSLGTRLAKWFFAAAATGLVLSSLLGLWIALTQSRQRRLAWGLLAAGALIPVLMIAL